MNWSQLPSDCLLDYDSVLELLVLTKLLLADVLNCVSVLILSSNRNGGDCVCGSISFKDFLDVDGGLELSMITNWDFVCPSISLLNQNLYIYFPKNDRIRIFFIGDKFIDQYFSVGFRKVRTFSKNFEDNFRKIKFRKKKLRKLKFVLIFSKNFEKVRIISNFN